MPHGANLSAEDEGLLEQVASEACLIDRSDGRERTQQTRQSAVALRRGMNDNAKDNSQHVERSSGRRRASATWGKPLLRQP